jgi:hypothetical protein
MHFLNWLVKIKNVHYLKTEAVDRALIIVNKQLIDTKAHLTEKTQDKQIK